MAIEYRKRPLSKKQPMPVTNVMLDGKKVGEILLTRRGRFMYAPKGNGLVGEQFPTEAECRRSLEQDD